MAIDLRSDTVTRPSPAMREAMAEAKVGDDVYREDPTVAILEQRAAELVGQEAALFVPSGTMGNQIALHLHGESGGEVIAAEFSHIFLYEMGMMAQFSGLMPKPVPTDHGRLTADGVRSAFLTPLDYRSGSALVVVENTHNMAGGITLPLSQIREILATARELGLPVHLDGARVFNAATALNQSVKELSQGFDSVMFCLSKGLGAPVGSLLCGRRDFVEKGRRIRKMLGGGMRQVGILAAAGLVALEEGPRHLESDHRKAAYLEDRLRAIPGIRLDLQTVETNIVIFDVEHAGSAPTLVESWGAQGLLAVPLSGSSIRFVTHRDVSDSQIEEAIEMVNTSLTARGR